MAKFLAQARISAEEMHALERRAARDGCTVSAIVREGIRLQHAQTILSEQQEKIIIALREENAKLLERLTAVEDQTKLAVTSAEFEVFRGNLREMLRQINATIIERTAK